MKIAVRRVLLMSALLAPGAVLALGLGEIKLNSALNQPFDAEIELVSATQEDLGALRAALASNDTFVRYGLDRPAFLTDFNFRVAKGSSGQDVLRVTSPRPVTEPFVTLLVEANWPRGRLLREYTVLLDPPVFAPGPAASAPVAAAPRVTSGGAASARAAAPVADETTRSQVSTPAPARSVERAPAIEPGSTYRVQRNDTLWEIARAASPGSRSDVNRAMVSIFQTNPQAFDGNINVLRSGSTLRIPDAEQIRSISAADAAAEVARQYDAWRSGAATAAASDAGRLRLVTPEQGTTAPSTSIATAASRPDAAAAAPAAGLEDRVRQLEDELAEAKRLLEVRNAELATLQGGTPAAVPGATPSTVPGEVAVTPEEAAAAPAATPEAAPAAEPEKPKKAKKPKKVPAEPAGPSLFERLADYWWVLLALLGAGLAAWLFQRQRRERGSAEDSLEEALGRDIRSSAPKFTPRPRDTDILVEEKRGGMDMGRGAAAAAASAAGRATDAARKAVTVEDTLSGDGAASMESGDPLAEADFHMAYGLYDQAADLVQLAMKREPQRRDLKLKLLEIYFVWGNKDRFLDLARDLGATRANAPAGEWDKVLIMGKQIAPGDALFSGAPSAAASDSLDMELHGSPGMMDLTIPDGASARPDLDLTGGETTTVSRSGIDFVFDEPTQKADDSSVLPTIETPRISGDSTADTQELTIDTPRLAGDAAGDTQELTVDKLGLDLGTLRDLESLDTDEATAAHKRSGGDTLEMPQVKGGLEDTSDMLSATSLTRILGDDTAQMRRDETLEGVVDLSEVTGELPSLDIDLGAVDSQSNLNATGIFDLGSEPATMSEVGTKLDLARAYMDMGDPEGARSILDEVLQEGNPNQRQEAERLIASLP